MSSSARNKKYKVKRAACACEECHVRKVRCDATTLGTPCTNCAAFFVECRMPVRNFKLNPKTRKRPNAESDSQSSDPNKPPLGASTLSQGIQPDYTCTFAVTSTRQANTTATEDQTEGKTEGDDEVPSNSAANIQLPYAPVTNAGRIAYFGESCTPNIQLASLQGHSDLIHHPLHHNLQGPRAHLTRLDALEIEALRQRGAFLLPPKTLCDELIDSYFRWIHPLMPIINRAQFMTQYRDSMNPPSFLLLQAMFSAATRVCNNPGILDDRGSTFPAALTFYKRAKALYDADYEHDRVTVVQSLLLIGWCWGGSVDVMKSVLYWTRLAVTVAQDSGMHRSVEHSKLRLSEERLRKRIWWTLFTRDRSIAVALGQPTCVNLADSDLGMLTEDDFIEGEEQVERPSEYLPDSTHVQFFLQYVKLYIEVDVVLSGYLTAAKQRDHTIDFTYIVMVTDNWFKNCPSTWNMQHHSFWSAILHCNYFTIVYFIHRTVLDRNNKSQLGNEALKLSRNTLIHAAEMIASIVECLSVHDEIRYCPTFIVYSCFSVSIIYLCQMRSTMPSARQSAKERLHRLIESMNELSRVWLIAKMVQRIFSSILGDKIFSNEAPKAISKEHQASRVSLTEHRQHGTPAEVSVGKCIENFTEVPLTAPNLGKCEGISRPPGNSQRMPSLTRREVRSACAIGGRSSSMFLSMSEQHSIMMEFPFTFQPPNLQFESVHPDESKVIAFPAASLRHRDTAMDWDATCFETCDSVGGSTHTLPFNEPRRREFENSHLMQDLLGLQNQRTPLQKNLADMDDWFRLLGDLEGSSLFDWDMKCV